MRERLKRWFAYAPALPGLPAASSLGQPERCAGFIKPATHPDVETAKCPESLRPILVLPPLERPVPPLPRALPLRHRYYQLVRQTHLAFLSFDFWSRSRKLCRLLPAPAASGFFPTLSLRIFPVMPGPLSRRLADCTYLVLPLPQRPSPLEYGSAYRNFPLKRLHSGAGFRDCSHFFMFKPHSLLVTLIAPTQATGFELLPRWDFHPLFMPAFAGRTLRRTDSRKALGRLSLGCHQARGAFPIPRGINVALPSVDV